MLTPRRIPFLQILNNRLVKTEKFKKPQYVGDPLNAVKIFNSKEVDELIIVDITPEKYKIGPDFEFIETLLSECQMPVGYGGGIRHVSDAHRIFRLGAEKVVINTLVFENPQEAIKISQLYGSQAVSFSIDYKINLFKKFCFYKNGGTQKVSFTVDEIVELAKCISCGEIILHDMNNDGKFCGFGYDFLNQIKDKISVPIVLLGGARNNNDLNEAVILGAHSAAAGSMFIYQGPHKAVLIQY
jgi:cyclase